MVAAYRKNQDWTADSHVNRDSITPNHDASANCTALTATSASIVTPPAATGIKNDTMRCFQKLRCFSTPQASFTALVIAPNTPSDAQIKARPPATPTGTRV